jgi:peptide/nickel transport system substrate-binding protein
MGYQPDLLNPLLSTSSQATEMADLLFLKLTDFGPPPELADRPMLAESWELSDDGLVLTYTLREDVVWEDGVPTTADDVKFTFDRMADPDIPYRDKGQIRHIESCDAPDPRTVRFRFRKAVAEPVNDTRFHVLPAHLLSGATAAALPSLPFNRAPVGNAFWRLREWVAEDRLVFDASETCALGRAGFDRLVFRIIPEETTLRTELETGGVHVYHRMPSRFFQALEGRAEYGFGRFSDRTYTYIGWNHRAALFADPRVRRALTMVTDRQTIVDAFRVGFGQVIATTIYPEHWAFHPGIEPYPFDPAAAGRLLDEAGWSERDSKGIRMKDGQRFEFTFTLISGNEISEEIATMVQADYQELGIGVDTEFFEWTVYLEKIYAKDFDATVLASRTDFVFDPEDNFHTRAIAGGHNSISFSHPVTDSLMDRARVTQDREETKRIWREFQEVMHRLEPVSVLYAGEANYPYRRDRVAEAPMDSRGALVEVHRWRPAGGAS